MLCVRDVRKSDRLEQTIRVVGWVHEWMMNQRRSGGRVGGRTMGCKSMVLSRIRIWGGMRWCLSLGSLGLSNRVYG